ncbi:thioredoxin family protein [Reyranella sp.]|uniref:thioredoxin family protein n=1 Tax=Reyranella sp. TaxID=1929291 RepID=UPI003783CB05
MMRPMLYLSLLLAALGIARLPATAQQAIGRQPGCILSAPATPPGSNGPNPFVDPCKVGPALGPPQAGGGSAQANPAPTPPWLAGWPANVHINDLVTAHNRAARQGKLLFVVFGADWCNYCKAMKRESFADARILTLLAEDAVVVLDVEKDDQHNNIKQLMNRLSIRDFPAFALVQIAGSNPGLIGRIIGYHDREQFYNALYQLHPMELIQGKERPNPPASRGSPLPPEGTPAK